MKATLDNFLSPLMANRITNFQTMATLSLSCPPYFPLIAESPLTIGVTDVNRLAGDGRQVIDPNPRRSGMQAKKVRVAEIERIRGTMKNAPEHPVDEVTTAEAVRMLSPEIHAMQAKGYGLPAIAAHLSDSGLAMTTKTLKTYLTEARATGGRKKRRTAKRGGSATAA